MRLPLDPDSPVPLFHQIAEAFRYKIAIGELRPGDRLPSVRDFADDNGLHYLTVRKGYLALAESGLVTMRRGIGTTVVETRSVVSDAVRGVSIHVVECNAPQCEDYARQLCAGIGVPVGTWLLEDDDPPAGLLIGTYFHFNEMRQRWPSRASDLRFVAVGLDPGVGSRLTELADGETPIRVRVCETRESRVHNAIPDLLTVVPAGRFVFEPHVVTDIRAALIDEDDSPVLFAPRLWARLDARQRRDPRVVELRYTIAEPDLAAIRREVLDLVADPTRRVS